MRRGLNYAIMQSVRSVALKLQNSAFMGQLPLSVSSSAGASEGGSAAFACSPFSTGGSAVISLSALSSAGAVSAVWPPSVCASADWGVCAPTDAPPTCARRRATSSSSASTRLRSAAAAAAFSARAARLFRQRTAPLCAHTRPPAPQAPPRRTQGSMPEKSFRKVPKNN